MTERNEREPAVTVEDLCIDYKTISNYSIKQMLLSGKRSKKEDFHAVKHISFELKQGEILGVIGKNGCGKSTMLKGIAGIFAPNQGRIDLHDKTVSLLAIGVGFNKAMTGRQNILLSGMLLGFSKEHIEEKMDEIIEFAELGQFIDMPVRTYSSGMYSKLGFSVTAVLETEIMLIDEVLSVGDEKFKKKSLNKMKSLIKDESRTVIIVSHSIPTLLELCTSVMWMHDGEIKMMGDPKTVLDAYKEFMK